MPAPLQEVAMSLKATGIIELPDSADTLFDHGAFDSKSRRVFVAHTARDRIEVIDRDGSCHLATLSGFPEAAGVVADEGHVLVTNRGAASLAWLSSADRGCVQVRHKRRYQSARVTRAPHAGKILQ